MMRIRYLTISFAYVLLSAVFMLDSSAVAGTFTHAEFRVSVSPPMMSLNVNSSGGISGSNQVTVNVQRIKRNKVASCNKVRKVNVTGGGSSLGTYHFIKRGLCFFNINLTVNPFYDWQLRDACKGISSGTKKIVKDGMVYAVGTRGRAINQAPIKFIADISCNGGSISSGGTGTTPPAPAWPQGGARFLATCTDKNRGISVQVDMDRRIGTLYMNKNNVFRLSARYLPIRGAPADNLIELKGNGARAFHLNRSKKILYFREGTRGEFCKLRIERR